MDIPAKVGEGTLIEFHDESIYAYIILKNREADRNFIIKELPPRHVIVDPDRIKDVRRLIDDMIVRFTFEEDNKKNRN